MDCRGDRQVPPRRRDNHNCERNIPQNDVAVIDFTGGTMTDADWAKFSGGTQIVLRNGQSLDGQLIDIGGTNPLRLSIRTGSAISATGVSRLRATSTARALSGEM